MRASSWLFGGLSCFCAALGAAAGCSSFDVCSEGLCAAASESGSGAGPSSSVTGTGGSSTSSAGGGGAGGSSPNCDPGAGAVDPSCHGVFVSSSLGDDTGDGSKAHPVKTLAAAFGLSAGTLVYACGELFASSVHVPAGASLYGGLKCATDWSYDAGTPTQIIGNADTPAVTLDGGVGVTILADLAIAGGDALSDGGSSTSVFASNVTATIERCVVSAGRPHAGSSPPPGADGMNSTSGIGTSGGPACMAASEPGGAGGMNTCTGGVSPDGGKGGDALLAGGQPGTAGGPNGTGGTPGTAGATCTNGGDGAPAAAGAPGVGAPSLGSLGSAGYESPTASGGKDGAPGFGGGGGGATNQCSTMQSGASGGGGGAGGCGAAPGAAGVSGGSSVGVASLHAHLTLDHTTVTVQSGATGGTGSAGGTGASGGPGGAISTVCRGGNGGKGGDGGPGGGGAGGSSLGIAVQGGSTPILTSSTVTVMSFGTGGLGGDMVSSSATRGKDGAACRVMDLANTTCVE